MPLSAFHQQHIRLSPDVMARHVGNELFILKIKSECYFGLDELGSRILTLLTEGSSIGEMLRQVESEYAVDPEVLTHDTDVMIAKLIEHQLIQIVVNQEP